MLSPLPPGHAGAWERKARSPLSFLSLVGPKWPHPPLPFLLPPAPVRILATPFLPHTCVIDCISHLVAVDGAGLVCVIVLENFLAIENLRTGVAH